MNRDHENYAPAALPDPAGTRAPGVRFPLNGEPWALRRGATLDADGSVRFEVWAPAAERVAVRVLSGAERGDHVMAAQENGVWATRVEAVGGGDYQLVLGLRTRNGETVARPDPVSRFQPDGVHGPSRVVDPHAFRWTDGGWRGLTTPELVLYELHVGTFTAEGTFDATIQRLRHLHDLGITAIELMPLAQFPGARNWGYDGVDLYAPQSTYGGPEALRRLVDAAHGASLGVVLDVVYNHLGPEGNYLGDFGFYFTDRYRTPWGRAVNYDDAHSDEVRRFVIENALYWVTEYHVDALRLDAVHAIFDFSARHILDELGAAVHDQAARLGRRVLVIAESDLNDPRLVRRQERGGYGLDAQWSDDFHHAVHVALTGERHGYYEDFGGVVPIAKALGERFVYGGTYSAHRRRRHGAPATDVPAERFVVFTQNHDQIGNRATGDRLAALVSPAQRRLAAATLLLSPYVPMLFMGEEYGETNPFLYFVSHSDSELVEAVRQGRHREFAAFDWQGDVPDPQSEETFARSRLNVARIEDPEHAAMLELTRDLLRVRAQEPLLRPGAAHVAVEANQDHGWVLMILTPPHTAAADAPSRRDPARRPGTGRALAAALNFSDKPRTVPLTPAPGGAAWTVRLATEAARYRGDRVGGATVDADPPRVIGAGDLLEVTVPASSAVLLAADD